MVSINVFGRYPHGDNLAAQDNLSSRSCFIRINPVQP